MKIVGMIAENIKKITVIEINPAGNLVQITGRNGAGKSSVLDAIWMALEWSEAAQPEPIRKGANNGRIRLDLGDMIVTRTFARRDPPKDDIDLLSRAGEKAFTTAIKVESRDGARYPSPQAMIDKLIGGMSLDPVKFLNAKPPEQIEMVRVLVPDFNFAEMDAKNAEDYERRTEHNRYAREYRARAASIAIPDGIPAERVDEDALTASLEDAGKIATQVERLKAADNVRRLSMRDSQEEANASRRLAIDHRTRAAELTRKAEVLEFDAADCEARAKEHEQYFAAGGTPYPTIPDTGEIKSAIVKARLVNNWIDQRLAKETYEAQVKHYEGKAEELTTAMRERDNAIRAAVANANLGIPNMSIDGKRVLMNGVPFEQASDAERLRASVAIAMASNPKLRVIRIRDGSLLDDDGLKLIAEMADANDTQVWIERVDSSGKVGFVMENGHLKQ